MIGVGAGLLHVHAARMLARGHCIATDILFLPSAELATGADFTSRADEDMPARVRECNDGILADLVIVCTERSGGHARPNAAHSPLLRPVYPGATFPLSINDLLAERHHTSPLPALRSPAAGYALALESDQGGQPESARAYHHRFDWLKPNKLQMIVVSEEYRDQSR